MNGLVLTAFATLAAPTAIADLPPVGCIVTHTDRLPHADLIELVKAGFVPTTKSGTVTMELVSKVVQQCRRTYGWAKPRENAAVRYFSAWILRDEGLEQGRRLGLREAAVDGYVAGLRAEARAAYAAGKVTPELNRAAFVHLQADGVKLDAMTQADVQALGMAFNMSVYATIARADGERSYAGR